MEGCAGDDAAVAGFNRLDSLAAVVAMDVMDAMDAVVATEVTDLVDWTESMDVNEGGGRGTAPGGNCRRSGPGKRPSKAEDSPSRAGARGSSSTPPSHSVTRL
jgi:hypothetical protein